MFEVSEKSELREIIRRERSSGKTIGLVPTMGYLHEGHLSLVRKSVEECDFTVVTIFVNPAQFGPSEDLDKYPREYLRDKKLLEMAGADLIYSPTSESLYRDGHSTWVIEDDISKSLCGVTRPGHFKGVLTIVAKLFNIVQPDKAYFGQKDYQQANLIINMVEELDFPIEIVVCPIIREQDGLALSSRNTYLSDEEREQALVLNRTINEIRQAYGRGIDNVEELISIGMNMFNEISNDEIGLEYLEIRDADTLEEISSIDEYPAVVLIAAVVGSTRLIDNMLLKKEKNIEFSLMTDREDDTGKSRKEKSGLRDH